MLITLGIIIMILSIINTALLIVVIAIVPPRLVPFAESVQNAIDTTKETLKEKTKQKPRVISPMQQTENSLDDYKENM